MRIVTILFVGLIFMANSDTQAQSISDAIAKSRSNTVRVIAKDLNSSGTGFFIDKDHIITCQHVVALIQGTAGGQVNYQGSTDIKILTYDGEEIPATCLTIPTQQDLSPINFDFAILKLSKKPKTAVTGLSLYNGQNLPDVGTDLVFSGFPLGVPAMVTHKGMLSGITDDKSIICVQASINKGNSGGALINEKGEVLGIVSMREGGISQNLSTMAQQLNDLRSGKNGITIQQGIGGVDTIALTTDLINTLNQFISTGIGYARSIKFVQEYIKKNPNVLK